MSSGGRAVTMAQEVPGGSVVKMSLSGTWNVLSLICRSWVRTLGCVVPLTQTWTRNIYYRLHILCIYTVQIAQVPQPIWLALGGQLGQSGQQLRNTAIVWMQLFEGSAFMELCNCTLHVPYDIPHCDTRVEHEKLIQIKMGTLCPAIKVI